MDSTDISIPAGHEPERYAGIGGLEPPTTPMAAPAPAFPAAAQPPQQSTHGLPPQGGGQAPAPQAASPSTGPQVQAGDHCPSCGALLATDQRYCLECGYRRGDPRLPFMDAVVLMDAVKRPADAPPPPAKKKRTGISPNAALIAGVGTLLMALGIGVLIGRSGNHQTASTAPAAPIVIKGGGEEVASTTAKPGATTADAGKSTGKASKKSAAAAKKEASTQKGAEEVLKPAAGVNLPPAEAKLGESCEKGTAGCSGSGKFEGNFFGE